MPHPLNSHVFASKSLIFTALTLVTLTSGSPLARSYECRSHDGLLLCWFQLASLLPILSLHISPPCGIGKAGKDQGERTDVGGTVGCNKIDTLHGRIDREVHCPGFRKPLNSSAAKPALSGSGSDVGPQGSRPCESRAVLTPLFSLVFGC